MSSGTVDIGRVESKSNRVADRAPVSSAVRDRRWFGCRRMDTGAATDATGSTSPRIVLVFCLRQCDKKNRGWREGPPLTVPCQSFDPLAGLHPPDKQSDSNENKNTAFCRQPPATSFNFGRFKATVSRERSSPASESRPFSVTRPKPNFAELDAASGPRWGAISDANGKALYHSEVSGAKIPGAGHFGAAPSPNARTSKLAIIRRHALSRCD